MATTSHERLTLYCGPVTLVLAELPSEMIQGLIDSARNGRPLLVQEPDDGPR